MTIGLAQLPLQGVVYTLLRNDATLAAMIGGVGQARVFDFVPDETPYPYVVVGDATEISDDVHGAEGRELTLTIHVWTDAEGTLEAQTIGNRVSVLLHGTAARLAIEAALAAAGSALGLSRPRFDFGEPLRDYDEVEKKELRRQILRFRFNLYER